MEARVPREQLGSAARVYVASERSPVPVPRKRPPGAAYIASNDYAVGLIVAAISHSKIWPSSAIFITEDDAQDGADHVSDQRTTFYIASPQAKGGLEHHPRRAAHHGGAFKGMQPLSNYDAERVAALRRLSRNSESRAVRRDFAEGQVYHAKLKSRLCRALAARLDFSRPDAVSPGIMTDMLSQHAGYKAAATR